MPQVCVVNYNKLLLVIILINVDIWSELRINTFRNINDCVSKRISLDLYNINKIVGIHVLVTFCLTNQRVAGEISSVDFYMHIHKRKITWTRFKTRFPQILI